MRGSRKLAIGTVVVLMATVGLSGVPAAADDGTGHGEDGRDHVIKVAMLDRCYPVTFAAGFGNGTAPPGTSFCEPVRQHRRVVTYFDLLHSFDSTTHTADPAWRFSRTRIEAEVGDTIHATNLGGQFHSFTEVPAFGGGCNEYFTRWVGLDSLPGFRANCPFYIGTVQRPGQTTTIALISAGEHKFMCVIHPWMKATVDVKSDEGDD